MGTNFNFKNFGNDPPPAAEEGGGGRPPGSFPLARQSSVYSLTFGEFQSTMGGIGKDFGSMNMDELLKNIWSAEENQITGSTSGGVGQEGGGYLQRQGSLTLPRTLSQKTVDEVWRDMAKEYGGRKDESSGINSSSMPQGQQTLGEITLEEFLLRAGVVKEDTQLTGKPNGVGDLSCNGNNPGLGFVYQQTERNAGLMTTMIPESRNQIAMQTANLPLNVNGFRSSAQQLENQQPSQQELLSNQPTVAYRAPVGRNQIAMQSANLPFNVNGVKSAAQQLDSQQQSVRQQHELLPKQPALTFGAPTGIPCSGQFSSPAIRGGIVGISGPLMTNNLVQNAGHQGGGMGVVGLGAGNVTVATRSPAFSTDGLVKGNGDTSSISPVPYVFSGGLRGRKGPALEKVVERRQRRMIKNRESAARSRARKQAYTTELETEIAKLKEENHGLQKKQAEIMKMQKNQALEIMNHPKGAKRRCLRRTQTGPW